jgi:hypothetical protein
MNKKGAAQFSQGNGFVQEPAQTHWLPQASYYE